MTASQRSESAGSVDYSGVLRRRWWVVVVLTVIGVVGALGYAKSAPKSYTATAAVYVAPTGADQSSGSSSASSKSSSGSVNLETEAQLVTSGTVAAMAGKSMKSPLSAYQLSKQVSVTVPPSSQVLNIACETSSASSAATCANDFAAAYLSNRQSTAAGQLASQMKALQAKVSSLQKSVTTLNTSISALPTTSSTRLNDETTVSSDKTLINSFNQQLSTLTAAAANTSGGHIITSATPPGKPSSPKTSVILPAGLVVGLVLGLIVAFVWDGRDRRLHGTQDVERLLDVPVLLSLPRGAFGQQVSLASPRSRAGRAFTELAHTMAASLGEGSHVVLVAGTSPGPETSVVAANLAATLARTQAEAVLVCADLRDSVAPELLGLDPGSRGLAEVVAGRATVGEVARGPSGVPGLWVIPPGADPSLAEYHLQHDTAKALTTQLRRDARYVIIEAQATEGADTFALAEFADTALLTIQAGRTRRDEAGAGIRRLQRMRTPLMGTAVLYPLPARFTAGPPQPSTSRAITAGQAQ
jgi:capsular polysaccharide biosynthesis protein